MRISFTPRTTEFFTLFSRAGENALQVARLVERRFREHPSSGVTQEQVKAEETESDEITRDLINLLNTQYVTPFDREDIYELATAIDDIVDNIFDVKATQGDGFLGGVDPFQDFPDVAAPGDLLVSFRLDGVETARVSQVHIYLRI